MVLTNLCLSHTGLQLRAAGGWGWGFIYLFIYVCMYVWLRWVFVAVSRLSLVAASGLLIAVASLVAEHGL